MDTGSNELFDVATITLNPAIDQTATVPGFASGKVNRVQESQAGAGGKGVNVASILSDYGHRVSVTGLLGRENAAIFEELFARKHISDCFVRIAGQTRIDVKIADPDRGETTDINFPGQAPAPSDVHSFFSMLPGLRARWYVLAGSLPPGVQPTLYRDLIERLKAKGRRVVLDTSGDPLSQALAAARDAAMPDIIKPNVEELQTLVGRPLDSHAQIVQAARDLLARGVSLVVVSMGGDGALFVATGDVIMAKPPQVGVKSTVGAGDAMVAGIVAGQLRDLPLDQAARLATAFAADAISHIGGGLSSAQAVEALMEKVTITRMSV